MDCACRIRYCTCISTHAHNSDRVHTHTRNRLLTKIITSVTLKTSPCLFCAGPVYAEPVRFRSKEKLGRLKRGPELNTIYICVYKYVGAFLLDLFVFFQEFWIIKVHGQMGIASMGGGKTKKQYTTILC